MWWKTFFDTKYKKYLKQTYPETSTKADLRLIKKFINKKSVILDLACGYGRLFIPLKRERYKIFGLDYSRQMTSELRRQYKRYVKIGDMREKNFKDDFFNLVFCYFSSFGYFSNAYEDFMVVARTADALKKGGTFILDLRSALKTETEKMLKKINGEIRHYIVNRYALPEIRKMAQAAGFRVIAVYGDRGLSRYTHRSRRMIVVMKKT